jgi:hypothetical protein
VEREVPELCDRLPNQNLWIGCDWHHYYCGLKHGRIRYKPVSENPFYILGYQESSPTYENHH